MGMVFCHMMCPQEYELEEGTSPPTDDTAVLGSSTPHMEPSGGGGGGAGTASSAVGEFVLGWVVWSCTDL